MHLLLVLFRPMKGVTAVAHMTDFSKHQNVVTGT